MRTLETAIDTGVRSILLRALTSSAESRWSLLDRWLWDLVGEPEREVVAMQVGRLFISDNYLSY